MLGDSLRRHLLAALVVSTAGACGDDAEPTVLPTGPEVTSGSIAVILALEGEGNDADGVTVSLWAGSLVAAKSAMLGDTVAFGQLTAGTYTVSVAGLDPLCRGDIADVLEVRSQTNTLRLQLECVGRVLYEQEYSDSRVGVFYVDENSRLRTLALSGRQHVQGTSPDGERALVEEWTAEACGVRVHTAIATLAGGVIPLQQNARRPVSAGAAWSPKGGLVAVREEGTAVCGDSDERAIVLFDPATGDPVRTVAEGSSQGLGPDVGWSPEGGRLAYVRDNVVLVYDVDTGGLSQLHAAAAGDRPREISWSPSGRYVLFRPTAQAPYRILDLTSGSVREIPEASAKSPAWHPKENLIAMEGGGTAGVMLLDAQTGTVTPFATAIPQAGHPSWNKEGDRLLLSGRGPSGARALYVVTWPQGDVWRVLEGDDRGPLRARWTRGASTR